MRYKRIGAAGAVENIIECDAGFASDHGYLPADDADTIGQVAPSEIELAERELRAIDAATGMSRSLRELLIAIAGDKAPAYMLAQEARAAAARDRIKRAVR
jgi:hypothetical protein